MSAFPSNADICSRAEMSVSCQNQTIGRSSRPGRNRKLKEGPVRLASVGPDASAMGFDDRAADCQSHSHAAGLCRVEWFKETREGFRVQPRAIILNPNVQIAQFDLSGGD